MKILLIGKGGQIASEFEELKKEDNEWTFLSKMDLDITKKESVLSYFRSESYKIVINCSGFTSVDNAEDQKQQAYEVNEKGVKNLVQACKESNCKLIQFSTDYVFDGESNLPYKESDSTSPINIYGKSKQAGEKGILNSNLESLIIRSSWVYSCFGNNFVKTILRLGKEKKTLEIVNDQIGTPTYARDLVEASLSIINNINYKWKKGGEILHYSNEGVCSWYDFAIEIFRLKGFKIEIKPKNSEEFGAKAKRPRYSVLDKSKIKFNFKIQIPTWEESLLKMIKQL